MKITSPHNKFILSSIVEVLKDGISSFDLAGGGIETYPLSDYVMQSIFLKMTGYQEQKLKCICWEIATYDYEYRYKRYNEKWDLGECSRLEDKKKVFTDLLNAVKKYDKNFDYNVIKSGVLNEVRNLDTEVFKNSNLVYFNEHLYKVFKSNKNLFIEQNFLFKEKDKDGNTVFHFLRGNLDHLYETLYRQRNRCAHNLLSYQQNLPDLKVLKADKKNFYGNYFLFFALLVLIDGVFTSLYEKYRELREISWFE